MPFKQPAVLDGTPYSLPASASGSIAEMQGRLQRVRTDLDAAIVEARVRGLLTELRRAQDIWTVFESNRIEFEGPDLAGTVRAIESRDGRSILRDLNVGLLPQVLRRDRDAYAAIGLEAARVIALRYVASADRTISQADLRDLHSVVLAGQHYAGQYRQFDAEIQAATHKPFPTFQIDSAMSELTDWMKTEPVPDDSLLMACVGHAWFTHIHPFQDGNGRVARLLANVLLGRQGLPPAIVKAQSQRSHYIAALAHSDEAGDIMPLVGLFLQTVERYVRQFRKPQAFARLHRQMVAGRMDGYFEWYSRCLMEFLSRLRVELALYGLEVTALDQLSRDVFDDTRWSTNSTKDRRENVTAAVVANAYGRELSIYLHTPTAAASRNLGRDDSVPSISFATPSEHYDLTMHHRVGRRELNGLDSFWIEPGNPVAIVCELNGHSVKHPAAVGVSVIADHIRAGFAAGFQPAPTEVRWTPFLSRL